MVSISYRSSLFVFGLATSLVACTEPAANPAVPAPPAPLADVELIVDDLGITHIYAQSDADAFFGSGYAMARDRLFHMELMRRRARGTRAELLGDAYVADDAFARTMSFVRLGKADEARARAEHPADAALFDAWTAGINLRIAEVASGKAERPYGLRPSELDFVPEPWEPFEAYAIGKLLGFGMSNNLDNSILATALGRLAPDAIQHLPVLMPTFDVFPGQGVNGGSPSPKPSPGPFGPPSPAKADPALFPSHYRPVVSETGSNNWAVAGAHTANGKPYVCGDPHQALTSPARFWPFHMNSAEHGGTLDVAGFAFVGTPTVELGHNAHVGWTVTTNFADVMDLWDVSPDEDAMTVALGGETVPLVRRDEVIRVKAAGAKAGTFGEEVVVGILDVPGYGVILPDEMLPVPRAVLSDGRLLFNWTGFSPSIESIAYLSIDRAKNIDEFEAAADLLEVGAANFVAADQGEITYHVHARIPDRGDPSARPMPWRAFTDPADPGSYWTRGDLPADKLPKNRAPAEGFLFTANTDPWGFTQDGIVENDPFYYGALYANGFRGHRIREVLKDKLASGMPVDRASMEEMQRDVHSPLADTVVPLLDDAIANVGVDPKLAAYQGRADLVTLASRLSAWDRGMHVDQPEPLIFEALVWFAAKRAFEKPVTKTLFEGIAEGSPPFFLGQLRNVLAARFADAPVFAPDGPSVLLLDALSDTSAWITTRFGSLDATFKWGDVHGALFETDFGGAWEIPSTPVGGGADTINVSPAPFFDGDAPAQASLSTEMSLYRMVTGFADDGTPEATLNFARGTSADPESPHFDDQDEAWTKVQYQKLAFRRGDVEAREESRKVIEGSGK